REDHRSVQVAHPLAALDFGMSHDLGERKQEAVLDQPAQRANRLLPCPAEVARRRRHDRGLLGPAAWPRSVPVPTSSYTCHVLGDTSDGCDQPAEPAVSRVPGHQFILWFTRRAAPSATADGMS